MPTNQTSATARLEGDMEMQRLIAPPLRLPPRNNVTMSSCGTPGGHAQAHVMRQEDLPRGNM